jgi:transposase-like protein
MGWPGHQKRGGMAEDRIPFPKTVFEFARWFPDDQACMSYLYRSRWPESFVCPKCRSTEDPYMLDKYKRIECSSCGHQTSVTAGTVLHRTRMPLTMWFEAAYHVATYAPGTSALQLQKHLGTSYETAFNILHKLRAAMVRPDRDRIHGKVEMDETFVGAPKPGKRGRGAEGKTIVLGAVEILPSRGKRIRSGRLRMRVVPDAKGKTIVAFAKGNVEPRSLILSDDLSSYDSLTKHDYRHRVVTSASLDRIHMSFGNFKTWILGTHHGVSSKHMQAYVNEFVFRHNRRANPMAAFQTILGLAAQAEGPTYRQLYAAGDRRGWVHPTA